MAEDNVVDNTAATLYGTDGNAVDKAADTAAPTDANNAPTDDAAKPADQSDQNADTGADDKPDDKADGDADKADDDGMKVPETPDGYKLPVPEGEDGAFAAEAAKWFHEAGIPPAQAEKLAERWNEFAAAQQAAAAEAEAAAEAAAEARYKSEDTALRKEWGDQYAANIELGRRAVKQFGFDADVLSAIESSVGPAKLYRIMANVGKGLGEDTAIGLNSNGVSNADQSAANVLFPGMK